MQKKSLEAGCNLVLYCRGNIKENIKLLKSVPYIDKFTAKKHQKFTKFYKIINGIKKISINIPNYSGPLEVLLDLAKSQKVNLFEISITKLADQFLEFIKENKDLNLETASEFLLMATWLAYLKSKLLLPEEDDDDFKALEVVKNLNYNLKNLNL